MKKLILILAILFITSCAVEQAYQEPLYFNVIFHNEEDVGSCTNPKAATPDYDGNQELLLHFTNAFREFGEMAQGHGVKINFGSDWTFSNGVENFDPTFYTDMEAMGHEIDAHAHQSCILYHEVREDIIDAGGTPTTVASGMEETNIQEQMEYFDNYPNEFEIFWGVAQAGHGEGEEISSWVWRPSRDNWLEHDPDGDYIHIGHGEQVNSINYIQEAIENRYDDRVNTYSVFIGTSHFLASKDTPGIPKDWTATIDDESHWENRIEWWDDFFTEVDNLENLEYASLTEVAEIFEQNEDNLNFDYDTENHPRSDGSMAAKNEKAGYPLTGFVTRKTKTLIK
ncbi:hypothetical protein HOC80_03435 [archaeon]|jgi:hypothetical protein|nr:hypothetical protein [archaeon]MBT4417129.1 hypothetical protein [archaeon]